MIQTEEFNPKISNAHSGQEATDRIIDYRHLELKKE